MKKFTYKEIESWKPYHSPSRYLPKNWEGTVLDLLDDKRIPFQDRLWIVLRPELVSEKLMRLFAVWCARQVQHLIKDSRSIRVLDVAEKFANGEATEEELDTARAAAEAAWAAARFAARATPAEAAAAAAWAAAWPAAWAAARAAAAGAWAAAWAAAREWALTAVEAAQENKLREMILAGVKTGDVACEESLCEAHR